MPRGSNTNRTPKRQRSDGTDATTPSMPPQTTKVPSMPPQAAKVSDADQHYKLNLMVAGASGQGKSTFINNLLFEFQGRSVDIGGKPTSRKEWLVDPLKFRYETDIQQCNVGGPGYETVSYTVQDTPGYGDGFNVEAQIFDIVNYVIGCQYNYYQQRQNFVPDNEIEDKRIDACLFFINPHRFQEIDLSFLKELSKVANIIPVIAKADSMLRTELHEYKTLIWDQIRDEGGNELYQSMLATEELFQTNGWSQLGKKLQGKHLTRNKKPCSSVQEKGGKLTPFAVICHKDKNPRMPYAPKRVYPWGAAESFNCDHCDFFFLKTLLLEASFGNLKARTKTMYQRYVQRMKQRWLLKKASDYICNMFLQPICDTANIPYDKPPAKRRKVEQKVDKSEEI